MEPGIDTQELPETGLPSMQLGEIVLKTSRYAEMKAWYRRMLALEPFNEHAPQAPIADGAPVTMCFFRLHFAFPYQQMIALFEVPGTRDRPSGDPGLHHMQLRNATRAILCERYRTLAGDGILPNRAMNHGPSTSFYYRDPDHNVVEISASNFSSGEEMLASFRTESFLRNPSGCRVDPQEVAERELGPPAR